MRIDRRNEVGRLLHSLGHDAEKANLLNLRFVRSRAYGKVHSVDEQNSLRLEALHDVEL